MTGFDPRNGPEPEGGASRPNGEERPSDSYAIEEEEQAPARRAASAQFVVESEAGAHASMRAAMDPANQSLAEALRLSYRLLQLVILALVVLFLFSGFQTVQEGFTGVRTLFGRIYGPPGQQQLSPGFTPFWPYPVGEIITVPLRRTVDLSQAFWPAPRRGETSIEQAIERASTTDALRPGLDGSLLTSEGDIAHVRITAEYTVDDVVDFLTRIEPAQADALVQRMLRRAAVHAAAGMTLAELVDSRESALLAVRQSAQEGLDSIDSGMTLTDVRLPARSAAFAVRRELPRVQGAREESRAAVQAAVQEAERILNSVAGPQYQRLADLIEDYEKASNAGDDEAANAALKTLAATMEGRSADVGAVESGPAGEVSMIINRARSFRDQIAARTGNEYRRFASYLPAYREDPRLVVRGLWLEAYTDVMNTPLLEPFTTPIGLGGLALQIRSSEEMMQERRNADLERKKQEANAIGIADGQYLLRAQDSPVSGPGRRLGRDAQSSYGRTPK